MDLHAVPATLLHRLVIEQSGCWTWTGTRHHTGYGGINYKGRRWYVHRLAYETAVGPVPEGMELDHLCRNRACANPEHLEPVTHAENMARSPDSGRNMRERTHCNHGHEFTLENTAYDRKGARRCRECARLRASARRAAGLDIRDPDKERARLRKWYADNREKVLAYQREYQRARRRRLKAERSDQR